MISLGSVTHPWNIPPPTQTFATKTNLVMVVSCQVAIVPNKLNNIVEWVEILRPPKVLESLLMNLLSKACPSSTLVAIISACSSLYSQTLDGICPFVVSIAIVVLCSSLFFTATTRAAMFLFLVFLIFLMPIFTIGTIMEQLKFATLGVATTTIITTTLARKPIPRLSSN